MSAALLLRKIQHTFMFSHAIDAPPLPRFLLVTAVFPLLFAGCGTEATTSQGRGPQATPVEVVEAKSEQIRETIRAVGTLRASEDVEIRPETSGIVEEVRFEEGKAVAEGQLLYLIDDAKLQRELSRQVAALESVKARLELAELTYERTRELVETDFTSREALDEAQANLRQQRAEIDRLESEIALVKERIEDTRIKSPFAGVVAESFVDAGDYVTVGDHLLTLYRLNPLETSVSVPERFTGKIRPGMSLELAVSAYPLRLFEGKVDYISPAVSESSRELTIKATILNDDRALKPGMFATAAMVTEVREGRPVLPEEALVSTRTGYIVFVVENGKAVQRDVKIGLRVPGKVEVRQGVEIGDTVVRAGHMNVTPGQPVQIIEDAAEPLETPDDAAPAGAAPVEQDSG